MTEKYTPEKVAELVTEARYEADLAEEYPSRRAEPSMMRDLAEALTVVSAERDAAREAAEDHVLDAEATYGRLMPKLKKAEAERDEARHWAETMQAQKFEWENREAKARIDRDRLHKAITDALAWLDDERLTDDQHIGGARANLRAALDKEGNDDE